MERKLATIRKISNIESIPNADQIELVTVDGWKVVAQKGLHKIGNLCVYCEIDSFLPVKPEFEFLRKSSFKKMGNLEGFRLKTIKLRGQISQGLLLPLDVFEGVIDKDYTQQDKSFYEILDDSWLGIDVTELLGIVKYEPPIPAELSGKIKGYLPSFIKKTDEERIQNLSDKYDELKKCVYYEGEKLEGTSATFYLKDGKFGLTSRNLDLLEDDTNTFWKVARELNIEEKLKCLNYNVAIQGELIGEGIQGNIYNLKGQTIKLFNIFNIDKQEYLPYEEFIAISNITLGLETIPIINDNFILPDTIDELLIMAEGKSKLNDKQEREGIVLRTLDRKISFKVINNKYLLKEK